MALPGGTLPLPAPPPTCRVICSHLPLSLCHHLLILVQDESELLSVLGAAGPTGGLTLLSNQPRGGAATTGLPPCTHRRGRASCSPLPRVPDTRGAGTGSPSYSSGPLPDIQKAAPGLHPHDHTPCSSVQEGWAAPQPCWQWREGWAGWGSEACLVRGGHWQVPWLLPASLQGRAHRPRPGEFPCHGGSTGRHCPPNVQC